METNEEGIVTVQDVDIYEATAIPIVMPSTETVYDPDLTTDSLERFEDFPDLKKSTDACSEIDKSMRTASSSSAISGREGDESDDLLSDYTSETTFFDADRSSTNAGKTHDTPYDSMHSNSPASQIM